jgi:hypothetical protein
MYYVTEFLSGGLITVLFSYAGSFYFQNPSYIKIISFLWGMPILYFYILFISLSISEKAAFDITRHGMYGIACSIFAMFTTLILLSYLDASPMKQIYIIGYNITFLVVMITIYMYYRIYDLN